MFGSVQNTISNLGRVTSLLVEIKKATSGGPVGDVVAVFLYWNRLMSPIQSVFGTVSKITQLLAQTSQMLDLLKNKPSIKECENPKDLDKVTGEIQFKKVTFSYDKGLPVLKDITFTAKPGTVTALVGKSGSGKSTIGSLIFRLWDPVDGEILVNGIDIRKLRLFSLRSYVAIVPQEVGLLNRSVAENVRVGNPDATMPEVEKACRAAAIHNWVTSKPGQYEYKVGEGGGKLSGGEKQRVTIARAFTQPNCGVLFLDEATSALDTCTEREVLDSIKQEYGKGKTIFIVAHHLHTIKHADQILVFKDGEIVQQGTHETLEGDKEGMYCTLWRDAMDND
jgi:ABC-type multidrug transport system fused ATPase/permease subunit